MGECYDNIEFKVNGRSRKKLRETIALILQGYKVKYIKKGKDGIMFFYYSAPSGSTELPIPFGYDVICGIVDEYLDEYDSVGKISKEINLNDWEKIIDMDGSLEIGWKVYTGDWGHIEGYNGFAVKPIVAWIGK